MTKKLIAPAAALLVAAFLGGCAEDGQLGGGSLITSAVPAPAAQPKVDAQCVNLAAQIDSLRKEGTIDRLQQASEGKTPSVQVKRTSLAKQAELNKLNGEFQAKCSTVAPKSAASAAPAPVAKEAAAAAAAVAPVAASTGAAGATKTAAAATAAPAATKKLVKKATAPVAAAAVPAAAAKPVAAAVRTVTPTTAAPGVVATSIAPAPARPVDVIVPTVPPANQ